MRIIDPHAHMYSRTVDDYEMMVLCGIEVLVEPSFWIGNDRKHAGSFFDYFNHISEWEPKNRAAKRGMKHFCTIAMNPKEAEDLSLAREVIAGMTPFLDRPTAIGIGEIGLNNITKNEETVLREQLEIAKNQSVPVIVHTPHNNKLEGTLRILAICKEVGIPPALVNIDHNTEETIQHTLDGGFYAGVTMYPRTKCTPQRGRDIIERFGSERVLLNSACDWETSDPLAVPKAARLMMQTGFTRAQTRRVVWENPYHFLAQSPKFKSAMEAFFHEDEFPAAK
jgi:predicted metal-dependent TIM-barrel fold hydrolase